MHFSFICLIVSLTISSIFFGLFASPNILSKGSVPLGLTNSQKSSPKTFTPSIVKIL